MLLDEITVSLKNRHCIVEGTALLPDLINELKINKDRVVYIVPTKDFQVLHYSKRQFARDILIQCESPNDAFENWMERDARFAHIIFDEANKLGMKAFRVDGNSSLEEMVTKVEEHFRIDL
jgi:2-phosphoglycerate kinase